MNINFKRSNDNTYRFVASSEENKTSKEIYIHYKGEIGEESHSIAQKVGLKFAGMTGVELNKPHKYQDSLGNYYNVKVLPHKKRHRFARFLTKFFKFHYNESKLSIEIKKVHSVPATKTTNGDAIEVLMQRKIPEKGDYNPAAFMDCYTEMAAEAFQKYEPEFAAHDIKGKMWQTDHCKYKIIENQGKLQLVPKEAPGKDRETLQNYINFMCKEYGLDKINYIINLYDIDLKGPLTPEVIYRINIGVGNLEKQDLDAFAAKMVKLTNLEKLSDKDLSSIFTTHELRNIARLIGTEGFITSKKLREWIVEYQNKSPGERQKGALQILSFTTEEKANQYTGREILYPIMSKYTIADKKHYKPWIDQQELLQVFGDLENSVTKEGVINWDCYCELLTHVVCKKHLARKHPKDIYRVGALIPAPKDAEGNQRWYVVSSCVSNGKGIHSYTLEPLDSSDSTLPAIKLYRSTSHSACAFDNHATVRNDINPINSPGYEGAEYSRGYEEEFFKSRSIPLWVGYYLQASQADKNEKIISLLDQSIGAYTRELLRPYEIKPLDEVIRKRDAELIEIAQDLMKNSIFNLFSVLHLIHIIFKHKKSSSLNDQKSDAQFLLSLVDQTMPRYQNLAKELKRAAGQLPEGEDFKEMQTRMNFIGELQKRFHAIQELHVKEPVDITKEDKQKLLVASINELVLQLHKIADAAQELPKYKKMQSVLLTGHSLGAACAQKAYVDYTASAERMPLTAMAEKVSNSLDDQPVEILTPMPDCSFTVRTFDPPAINAADNKKYHQYGEHADLFKWMKAKFSIVHRIEAGDFVSQGGEEHLGASTEAERKLLEAWCHFEASVTESLKHAKTAAIRDTPVAHATQFEKGKRHATLLIQSYAAYKNYLEERVKLLKEAGLESPTLSGNEAIDEMPIEETWDIQKLEEQIKKTEEIARDRIGDYVRTWIDAEILKKFDNGHKQDWINLQKVFKEVGIRSNHIETVRSMMGAVIRILLLRVSINQAVELHDGGHGEWWKLRDANNVFAVNLQGVQSTD